MNKRKGMTLIEAVIGIIVISIAFYALISVFVTMAPRTARVETINKKAYLAQEKIEEYLAKSFSNEVSVSPTNFTGYFSDYTYQILVTYVATNDLNTAVVGPTPFKNVKVRVWGSQMDPVGTVEITSIVATYEIK